MLWENFIIMERLKARDYGRMYVNDYFWRNWEKQEIDLLEEYGGSLHGYEFKWSTKKTPKVPTAFKESYPDSSYEVVNPENFLEFLEVKND
jgi:hypothetical protein